eukprot:9888808-Ditylum_brightwellii.AAC.1
MIEFGLDNCCMSHICNQRELFSAMRELPQGVGILGVVGIRKPEGIGTVVFQIINSKAEVKDIKLENDHYIPNVPKNLISISQWSREREDNCGVFSGGTYSIFLWEKDTCQKM